MNRNPNLHALDAVDAFIYEYGFELYMVFSMLCLVAIGLILARSTIRSHPLHDDYHRFVPPRLPRQPPVLPTETADPREGQKIAEKNL